jgi:hypothetical protein
MSAHDVPRAPGRSRQSSESKHSHSAPIRKRYGRLRTKRSSTAMPQRVEEPNPTMGADGETR